MGIGLKSWQVYEQGSSVPGGNVFESLVKLGFNGTWLLTGEGAMRREDKPTVNDAAPGYEPSADHPASASNPYLEGWMFMKETAPSPIKAAAVSYINTMNDADALLVVKFIIEMLDDPYRHTSDADKEEIRKIKEERARTAEARKAELANDQEELRPTGT